MKASSTALLTLLTVLCAAPGRTNAGGNQPPGASAVSREYAPGVRIDWVRRDVEIQAKVVLREGPLELFACSPRTREHESIFVVAARPLHIYQALGLIGLTPGRPVHYDTKSDRWTAANGERLAIAVSCGGRAGEALPARSFLKITESSKPPKAIGWVFAGSRTSDDGRFGADADGTVICVVDFDTALIAVGDVHTSDNDALWLEANPDALPPVGTSCTIIVSAAEGAEGDAPETADASRVITLELTAAGEVRTGGSTRSLEDFARSYTGDSATKTRPALRIRVRPATPKEHVDRAIEKLRARGFDRVTVEPVRPEADPGSAKEGPEPE